MMNQRITSIDALRGLVMFTMIFVNDLATVGAIVPDWMMHYELRHGDANGMTFVDLVFPAFLFIVGMSIPFALGSRMDKGERTWKTLLHVLQRTASLLFIGVLMVNEAPDEARLGWSPSLWVVLMFVSAISAFGSIKWMRLIGLLALLWLAYIWVGPQGEKMLTFSPFHLRAQWWGCTCLGVWLLFNILFNYFCCIITPAVKDAEAETLFPKGIRKVKPYLRYTPQPDR